MALQVAVAPLLSKEPAQPPLLQLWGLPHMLGVGTHLHVAQFALQVADAPLLSKEPAQPPLPQLWGAPHMSLVGVHLQVA